MDQLWNNPMVTNAIKSMSDEEVKRYKDVGQKMYGNIDFVDSKIINNMLTPMDEAVAYVEEGIKSGLNPADLEEGEIKLLHDTFGPEWYTRYNFDRDEVPEYGLSLKMKNDIQRAIKKKIDSLA